MLASIVGMNEQLCELLIADVFRDPLQLVIQERGGAVRITAAQHNTVRAQLNSSASSALLSAAYCFRSFASPKKTFVAQCRK